MTESITAPDGSLLRAEDPLLGYGLPERAAWHLAQAAVAYQRDSEAEHHLRQAIAIAPCHPAVMIGLYRFYFYKSRLAEALGVGKMCLLQIAHDLGLDRDWALVGPDDADFSNYGARLPRFYLFTLKACAYLQLRLGHTVEGERAVEKLLELDPTDKVGARVLLDVLQRKDRPADDDD